MATLGTKNTLRVLRQAEHGLYLDGKNLGDILIPKQYVPAGTVIGAELEVFVACDSDDRLIATTQFPRVFAGQFASLQVVSADPDRGAFLEWGFYKDLFLPRREQEGRVRPGDWVVVYVMVDERSRRLMATMRVYRHLSKSAPSYRKGEKVDLLIYEETELGYRAIVANAHKGLLYHTNIRVRLYLGQSLEGYIREVREDGKIDLSLDPAGYSRVAPLADKILEELKAKGGRLPYDDESLPEDIRAVFGCSKKAFKQAIGSLYKERRLIMLERGIGLPIDPPDAPPAARHFTR
jgi:predicted RNA-binding protein (virulence factor B family)